MVEIIHTKIIQNGSKLEAQEEQNLNENSMRFSKMKKDNPIFKRRTMEIMKCPHKH